MDMMTLWRSDTGDSRRDGDKEEGQGVMMMMRMNGEALIEDEMTQHNSRPEHTRATYRTPEPWQLSSPFALAHRPHSHRPEDELGSSR